MLRGLIDEWRLKNEKKPDHVALFIGGKPQEVREFFVLCDDFGVKKATACVETEDMESESPQTNPSEEAEEILSSVTDLGVTNVSRRETTDTDKNILFLSGREELVDAVREIAKSASQGDIEGVEASDVEKRLPVADEPDLVINALGDRLADKMLWQTVYSELCFVDEFNRRSFVRCLREYAERERRFGR